MDYIVDLIFLLDIFITFRTCIIDENGVELNTPMEIAIHYIKGQFTIDLLATVPLDLIIHSILGKSDDPANDNDENL